VNELLNVDNEEALIYNAKEANLALKNNDTLAPTFMTLGSYDFGKLHEGHSTNLIWDWQWKKKSPNNTKGNCLFRTTNWGRYMCGLDSNKPLLCQPLEIMEELDNKEGAKLF